MASKGLVLGEILSGEHAGQQMTFLLDLLRSGRLLLQASSGAGKSETVRKIATLTTPHVPNWIVDPEGEYAPLRSQLPFLLVGPGGEVPASLETVDEVVRVLLETGVSAIFDLFDLGTAKFEYARRLFTALDEAPKKLWRDLLVTIDEAHMLAPQDPKIKRVSSEAFANLASRGRKRGIAIVVATQRLALLDNNVAALCENMLFGRTGLIDRQRTADMLGYRGKAGDEFKDQISRLDDGDFFAYGRAFGLQEPTIFHVDKVPGATLTKANKSVNRKAPPTPESIAKLLPRFEALPKEVEQKAEAERDLRKQLANAQKQIRELQQNQVRKPGTVPNPAPSLNKEKVRMLQKKLEAMGKELQAAAVDAGKQDEATGAAIALIEQALQSLKGRAFPGKAIARAKTAQGEASSIAAELAGLEPQPVDVPRPVRTQPAEEEDARPRLKPSASQPATLRAVDDGSVTGPEQKLLDAIAWLEDGGFSPTNTFVAYLAGYSVTSSSFKNPRGSLRSKGMIDYPSDGVNGLTEAGRERAAHVMTMLTLREIQDAILSKLDGPLQKLLRPLLAAYPDSLGNEALAALASYSVTSSSFKNPRGTLRSLGLVEYPSSGTTRASDVLFPAA